MGLLAIALAWQGVLAARAPLPRPDAIRYVRMARSCQSHGLLAALVQHEDQPLYPLLLAATESWLREAYPGPQRWLVAARVVALFCASVAVVVLWRLFCLLWSPGVAWVAALLAALLPGVARMGADATADPVALLLWLVALWFGARAALAASPSATGVWRRQAFVWLFLAGVGTALAWSCSRQYLALLGLPGGLWFVLRRIPAWGDRLRHLALAGVSFGLGVAVVLGGWQLALRPAPPRAVLAQVLGWSSQRWEIRPPGESSRQQQRRLARAFRWRTSDGRKMAFWKKDPRHSIRTQAPGKFLARFLQQLAQAFHYLPALLAVVGIGAYLYGGQLGTRFLRRRKLYHFLACIWVLQLGLSFTGAWHLHYVSDRHLVPLAVLALPWSVVGIAAISRGLGPPLENSLARLAAAWRVAAPAVTSAGQGICFGLLLLGVIASCLLKWRRPPQQSQLAHRQAGLWISQRVGPGDAVLDTHGWSELFTESKTYLLANGRQALADPQLRFVAVQRRELQSPSRRGRTLREVLQRAGTLAGVFAAPEGRSQRDVLVFAWSPQRFVRHYRRPSPPAAPHSPSRTLPVKSVSHKYPPRTETRESQNSAPPADGTPDKQQQVQLRAATTALEQPVRR